MTLIDDVLDGLRLRDTVFVLPDDPVRGLGLREGRPRRGALPPRVVRLRLGACREQGSGTPLDAGDVAVLPRGDPHRLLSAPGVAAVPWRQILEGMGWAHWTPGARFKTVDVRLGSGEPTATLISGVFAFGDRRRSPLLDALPPVLLLPRTADSVPARVAASIVALLDAEILSGTAGAESLCTRLAEILFIHVVQHQLPSVEALPHGWLRGMASADIAPALALMHQTPEEPWSVATLARAAGMSRSRFAARFRDAVGQAPLDYLTQWRMYEVAGRLADGRIALPALAASVGYRSDVSFSKAFRRWSGRSPAAYRRWISQAAPPPTKP